MHELGIIQNAIEMAQMEARAAGGRRIVRLRLRIGKMSGVVPEALRFAFDVARIGTLAEHASLDIEHVEPMARCETCGQSFQCEGWSLACPNCGGFQVKVVQGLEVQLSDIEIE